jgi:hypothetical protein
MRGSASGQAEAQLCVVGNFQLEDKNMPTGSDGGRFRRSCPGIPR